MARVSNLVPVSDLRQDVSAVLKRLQASREPLVIPQRGRAPAVLLSVATHERREHELEILRMLARGEREIATGKGSDLDAVFKEADDLLGID